MVKFKSKPNSNLSVAGKLVKFGADGTCLVNKEGAIKILDGLSYVSRVEAPKKAPAKKEEAPKPKKKAKKKEDK